MKDQNIPSIGETMIAAMHNLIEQIPAVYRIKESDWSFYIPDLAMRFIMDALRAGGYPLHETIISSFRGIKILPGYEYGIVLAHKHALGHPSKSLLLKYPFDFTSPEDHEWGDKFTPQTSPSPR